MTENLLRIGELAARAEVSTRTVDYYTQLGLITPAGRTGGNYRLYTPGDIDRISLIRQLEAHGVSLDDIAAAFTSPARDLTGALHQATEDLHALQSALDATSTNTHGLLTAITSRIQGLINLAMQIPPDLFIP